MDRLVGSQNPWIELEWKWLKSEVFFSCACSNKTRFCCIVAVYSVDQSELK